MIKVTSIPALEAYQTLKNLSTFPIVYLISPKDEEKFLDSISSLCQNFLSYHQYPVILFHDSEYKDLERLATKIRGNCSIIDFSFALVNWTLPANYDPDQFPPQVWQFNFPSYHLMIRFWFKEIFEHPALLETKFYMRLDTDSLLLSPILVDPFQIMQRENLAYGWRVMDAESPFVSVGLSDFMAKYLGKNPESKKVALKNHFSLPSSKSGIPMMYNNFELVNMQRFRAMDMKEFIERVDASNGIFVHRWGDAPLRYFQCKMILDFDREVFSFLDFDYYHGNHKMFFKRGQWRTWYLFILTFLPWFFR